MGKIKIVTDSNSGISQVESKELDIFVVPMPFTIDAEEFLEDITISRENFYNCLLKDADVKTSQPSKFYLEELFKDLLKEYDEIVYIPMSKGLSGAYQNANDLSNNFNGRIFVVDNERISVTQKYSVLQAKQLANQGKSALQIKTILEQNAKKQSIYIMLSTLKYLKKGGRISATAATLANVLKIKPILFSDGGSFDKFAMALNTAQAKKKMIEQVKKDINQKFLDEYKDGKLVISVAHTQNLNEAQKFKDEIIKEFPNIKFEYVDNLSLSVACHIGEGALAIAICS